MKVRSQPYQLLIPIFLLILVLSFFKNSNETTDMHFYDTYVVMPVRFILVGFAVFIILLWGVYSLTNKMLLSPVITWVHIVITIIAVITLVGSFFWNGLLYGPAPPRQYADWSRFDEFVRINKFLSITVLVLVFSQSLYFINLIAGLFLKKHPTVHTY